MFTLGNCICTQVEEKVFVMKSLASKKKSKKISNTFTDEIWVEYDILYIMLNGGTVRKSYRYIGKSSLFYLFIIFI